MILILKHIDIEGPGTLGDFLENQGCQIKIVDLGSGEVLPKSLKNIEALIVLGGPMNVYEEDKYSFLKLEDDFIKKVLAAQIPYLGICLGAQLLAKAAGARVVRSPKEEIGFSTVELTKDASGDTLMKDLGPGFCVYQWHGDMFEIPQNGRLLATGKDCPHQAFRVGDNAYGLQFHVEITDLSIKEWSDAYIKDDPLFRQRKEKMLNDYQKNLKKFNSVAERIYINFLEIINASVSPRTN